MFQHKASTAVLRAGRLPVSPDCTSVPQVKYTPSGLVARRLRLSPRTLGRIVGTLQLTAGDEKVDVGLNVKHGGKNLRVADAVAPGPEGKGWCYSPSLIAVLQQYMVSTSSLPPSHTSGLQRPCQAVLLRCAWQISHSSNPTASLCIVHCRLFVNHYGYLQHSPHS